MCVLCICVCTWVCAFHRFVLWVSRTFPISRTADDCDWSGAWRSLARLRCRVRLVALWWGRASSHEVAEKVEEEEGGVKEKKHRIHIRRIKTSTVPPPPLHYFIQCVKSGRLARIVRVLRSKLSFHHLSHTYSLSFLLSFSLPSFAFSF